MRTFFVAISFQLAGSLLAQSPDPVTLRDASSNVANGGTLIVHGTPTDFTLEQELTAELNGLVPRTVNVRRYELNVVPGTRNYFAWGANMFIPVYSGSNPVWVGYDPLLMEAQEVSYFSAYFRPESVSGICCFQFVWYDVDTPNDSSWVNICFDTETFTGVAEQAFAPPSLDAYPNPVADGEVTFTYDAGGANGALQLVVHNAWGQRALVRSLSTANGRATVPAGSLAPGVWFAVLERDGRRVATQRVVVGH